MGNKWPQQSREEVFELFKCRSPVFVKSRNLRGGNSMELWHCESMLHVWTGLEREGKQLPGYLVLKIFPKRGVGHTQFAAYGEAEEYWGTWGKQ